MHKTDTIVKPIIGNRAIEKTSEIKYNHKKFTFRT